MRALLRSGELDLPQPGGGRTPERHARLAEIGRRDLSTARLVEGHADAVAILCESGRRPKENSLYAVWASDVPGETGLSIEQREGYLRLFGKKMFCSGAGLVDRALVTSGGPDALLLDLDLRAPPDLLRIDLTEWRSEAFRETQTATIYLDGLGMPKCDVVSTRDWYLERPGFWHGACGPAACWAGGAMGLVDYAVKKTNSKPHARAHLGAMLAASWALNSYLQSAGEQIDEQPTDATAARIRALIVRHRIEQTCSEILTRFGRALGPRPLIYDADIGMHHRELEIYIRQCHGEVDLEGIGEPG